ncbi:DUF3618 domain-containing protein [Aeromicrobium wangtongii]|uniref:DUF3618 domain-containing protein n=1 Tax=Aeromicrobium wangtongii TaxID=2969247 RepID=A0ABY5MBZ0_9ACTN|nr:DUF3618 domain-containing protein [Aeromicrobium wangtongii]MCD9197175.1 DUF3618 domain-containing protein [Aeromicrobium wangtongii]MCL3818097.1 DUF3618 domain-containing protein [Aeromicrobium wangtongii]UUP14671.1 DUF3618 domain-containing protein [Aeromicrobium wangtongii]
MAKAESDELVDQIDVIRERLAETVDTLIDRSSPKNIARRGLDDLKAKFVDETGSPRMETILPLVGGTVAVIASIIVIRRLLR